MIPVPQHLRPVLHNIVATVNLNTRLDLTEIATSTKNAEYNPQRFRAVIMRLRNPSSTTLIFASGKMVVTGTKTQDDSLRSARVTSKILEKLGFKPRLSDFKVENMVGTCDVKFAINLERFQKTYKASKRIQYESEIFPGLILREQNPKVVLIIFVSGKIVLTGAKSEEDILAAFRAVYPLVWQCRKAPLLEKGYE